MRGRASSLISLSARPRAFRPPSGGGTVGAGGDIEWVEDLGEKFVGLRVEGLECGAVLFLDVVTGEVSKSLATRCLESQYLIS